MSLPVPARVVVLVAVALLLLLLVQLVRRALRTRGPSVSWAGRRLGMPQTPARTWGLATSALIVEVNGGRHDVLSAGFPAGDASATLASAWNCTDRSSVRARLEWLRSSGDRASWESLRRAFDEGDPELEDRAFADPALRAQLEVINRYGQRHPSLPAWDLCRAVTLVRLAYAAGFIAEKESWKWVERLAVAIRSSFSSWREMTENYMVGREFVQGTADPDLHAAQLSLLDPANHSSPWNRLPWR